MSERRPPASGVGATAGSGTARAAGPVLLVLAAAQFLMTLDMSVMNVSIATVADDLGTTVTGIQTAITLYTLVMATLMITGGKIGSLIGRRRAFAIGAVIYAAGSATTAVAPNLAVLVLGWSILEGIGAALIMPAVVALVAANFEPAQRPKAYGLVASAGAVAVAVGPLIGGAATTYFSWRWVFAGEVVIAGLLLLGSRWIADTAPEQRRRLDLVGTALSVVGLGLFVFGILRSSEWGWVTPKPGAPSLFGLSATIWLVAVGLFVVWLFSLWEQRVEERGGDPLVRMAMLRVRQLTGGLTMFFVQFLLQSGVFFVIPLYLSVVLGLSAFDTGLRLVPLSVALLLAATLTPRFAPSASPRAVVRLGLLVIALAIGMLLTGIDLDSDASVVAAPLLVMGAGIGFLASQLGAVTVSAVPDEQSGEVGGLQNTATNLGASIGTALAGSILIAVLTTSLLASVQADPSIDAAVKEQATVQLAPGVPFLSDAQAEEALTAAGLDDATVQAFVEDNADARIRGLDASLVTLALIALLGLFGTGAVPRRPVGSEPDPAPAAAGGD